MTNNNKKSIQKLRQVFASIILSASCTIPVVAGNEKTHVDKPKKSTSSWIRTGLEVFLGAGFTWGVVEKIRNSRHINRLNQNIEQLSTSLSKNEQNVIKKLKDVIDECYNSSKKIYFLINDTQICYQLDALRKFNKTMELSVKNIDSEGFIKTYVTAQNLNLPKEPLDVTTNPFTKTLYILYLYESEKILNAKFERLTQTSKDLQNSLTLTQGQLTKLQQQRYIDKDSDKYENFKSLYDYLLTLCNENTIYVTVNSQDTSHLSSMRKKNSLQSSTTVTQYILQSYKESQKQQLVNKSNNYNLQYIADNTLVHLTAPAEADVRITEHLTLKKKQSIKTLKPSNLTELCQVFLSEFYLKSLCDYAKKENKPEHLETALNSISAAYLVLNLIKNTDETPKALINYYNSEFYKNANYHDLGLDTKLPKHSNELLINWNNTIKNMDYFNQRVTNVD